MKPVVLPSLGLSLCWLSLSQLAQAQTAAPEPAPAASTAPEAAPAAPASGQAERVFESSAGLKLLAGGNVWSTPSDIPPGYDGIGFAGDAGGFGWGGALYYEARFIKHLGLEVDLGYDSSALQRNVTYNNVVKITEKVTSSGPRIGFLAKGILETPFGRMWLGIGPEFLLPSSADASLEITEGEQFLVNAQQLKNAIHAEKKNSTMFTMALGLVIHVGENLEIPVDLRAAKNLSQESKWLDRVNGGGPTNYTVTAQSSWDFRLGTGLGYRF